MHPKSLATITTKKESNMGIVVEIEIINSFHVHPKTNAVEFYIAKMDEIYLDSPI
jgi:hypothetical protein